MLITTLLSATSLASASRSWPPWGGLALPPRRGGRVADRHHERELVVADIGGRRRERLGAVRERQRFLVERGGAGALRNAAREQMPAPIDAEREPGRALLAGGARRIALVALELRDQQALPARDRRGRGPHHPAGSRGRGAARRRNRRGRRGRNPGRLGGLPP